MSTAYFRFFSGLPGLDAGKYSPRKEALSGGAEFPGRKAFAQRKISNSDQQCPSR
ncbi:MAG TPA: hypothetical protein VG267_03505 [Terracidiphilus sp.]|jgi:hypothetical protein|nr:hypothetical protein [Terracidiphilus sp.]